MKVLVKKFKTSAILPKRMTSGSSGMDLHACLGEGRRIAIAPFHREVVPTGIGIELPGGFEAQVRPRSGLAKQGIIATFGTIDYDYRGEIGVCLVNLTDIPFVIGHGDRIAQLVACPVFRMDCMEVAELSDTARGTNGFGSTGVAGVVKVSG